jgi:hypothetical protein
MNLQSSDTSMDCSLHGIVTRGLYSLFRLHGPKKKEEEKKKSKKVNLIRQAHSSYIVTIMLQYYTVGSAWCKWQEISSIH